MDKQRQLGYGLVSEEIDENVRRRHHLGSMLPICFRFRTLRNPGVNTVHASSGGRIPHSLLLNFGRSGISVQMIRSHYA